MSHSTPPLRLASRREIEHHKLQGLQKITDRDARLLMDDLRKFARYFLPYKISLITGILCIFLSVVFNLAIPLFVGQAVDENWTEVSWSKLTVSALKVLGASLVSGTFLFLQRRILIGMSRHVEYDLRRDFYAHS